MNWKKIGEAFWTVVMIVMLAGIFGSMLVACTREVKVNWACESFGYTKHLIDGSDINGDVYCISIDGLEIVRLDSLFGLEE